MGGGGLWGWDGTLMIRVDRSKSKRDARRQLSHLERNHIKTFDLRRGEPPLSAHLPLTHDQPAIWLAHPAGVPLPRTTGMTHTDLQMLCSPQRQLTQLTQRKRPFVSGQINALQGKIRFGKKEPFHFSHSCPTGNVYPVRFIKVLYHPHCYTTNRKPPCK